jgi:hypothetical protein
MNTFRKLWQAVETLAASLAATVDAFNDQVRQRAGLDTLIELALRIEGTGEPEPAALPAARKRKS